MTLNGEMNSPIESVELLKPYIEGKTVCDLGAGDGEFMVALSKYAKVIGIERVKEDWDVCRKKGLNVIYGDFLRMELPYADFYYAYPYYHDVKTMMEIIPTALIIGSDTHKFIDFPAELSSQIVLNDLPNWRIAIWKK